MERNDLVPNKYLFDFNRQSVISLMANATLQLDKGYTYAASLCGTDTFTQCVTRITFFSQIGLGAYAGLFALSAFGILCTWLSRRLSLFIWIAWLLTNVIMIAGFALSSVLIPAAVIMSDGCYILNLASTNGFGIMMSPQNAAVANALMQDKPVLTALNITSSIAFSSAFSFPPPITASVFSLSSLTALQNSARTLSLSSFGVSQTTINTDVTDFNTQVNCNNAAGYCPYGSHITGVSRFH